MRLTMRQFRALTAKIEDDAEIETLSGEYIEIVRSEPKTIPTQIIMRIHSNAEHVELYVTDFILRVVGA